MQIEITKHFYKRFKQRLANTAKIQEYVENAYYFGKEVDNLNSNSFISLIQQKEWISGSSARIYKNFVYWFDGPRAITLYPIPQKMHKKIG